MKNACDRLKIWLNDETPTKVVEYHKSSMLHCILCLSKIFNGSWQMRSRMTKNEKIKFVHLYDLRHKNMIF